MRLPVGSWRRAAPVLLALAALALPACTINPPLDLAQLAQGESSLRLDSIPFYPQSEYQCGPAALAGVLGASGVDSSAEALAAQVYLPARQGSLQLELLGATRRAGRIPYPLATSSRALIAELNAGRPVLVLQNLRTRSFPIWHYAVLVGLDVPANQVYLNSGQQQGLEMSAPSFMRTWEWAGRWGMVALRPGELPAGADANRYLEAVLAFEAVAGVVAALPAWQAAGERWPLQALPYLAQGNHAYAMDNREAAVAWYYRGLLANPGNVALANNLASALGQLGCPRTAEAQLAPVLAIEPATSGWRQVLVATAAELAAGRGADPLYCYELLLLER